MREGAVLLFIGMAVVFAFLQLMVVVMNLSAKFFIRLAERTPAPQPVAAPTTDLTPIAVAIAAVQAHRR
jgi:sodium pump decarboxylase gamma subunit